MSNLANIVDDPSSVPYHQRVADAIIRLRFYEVRDLLSEQPLTQDEKDLVVVLVGKRMDSAHALIQIEYTVALQVYVDSEYTYR